MSLVTRYRCSSIAVSPLAMRSAGGEVGIVVELTQQEAPQQARLQFQQAAVAQAIAEQGMGDFMRQPPFECRDETFAPIGCQIDAAGSADEIAGMDFPIVDHLD